MKVIKNGTYGSFFIEGQGFTGTAETATQFSCADAADTIKCLVRAGHKSAVAVDAPKPKVKSFAVCYIRSDDIKSDGSIQSNKLNPSKRRFATKDEAIQHGSRFGVRRANAGDKAGTAGHQGFYVIESTDPVNAKINWKSGLTNPV